jgi:hypothetical protein
MKKGAIAYSALGAIGSIISEVTVTQLYWFADFYQNWDFAGNYTATGHVELLQVIIGGACLLTHNYLLTYLLTYLHIHFCKARKGRLPVF